MELARPDVAAGALFVDDDGRVMVVEPTYAARWGIPGGMVEPGETPREACARELREELGLDLPVGRLLVVDWAPLVREERVRFVFDGGTLAEDQLDRIELAPDELASWAFLPPEELFVMLSPRLTRRVVAALGPGTLDAVLLNRSQPDQATIARYATEGLNLLRPDDAEIAAIGALGVRPVVRDLTERSGERRALWNKQDTIRHDPTALQAALRELVG